MTPAVLCRPGTCDHEEGMHGWCRITVLPTGLTLGECLVCGGRIGPAHGPITLRCLVVHLDQAHRAWPGVIDLMEVMPVPPAPDNTAPDPSSYLYCCPRCATIEIRPCRPASVYCAACVTNLTADPEPS